MAQISEAIVNGRGLGPLRLLQWGGRGRPPEHADSSAAWRHNNHAFHSPRAFPSQSRRDRRPPNWGDL